MDKTAREAIRHVAEAIGARVRDLRLSVRFDEQGMRREVAYWTAETLEAIETDLARRAGLLDVTSVGDSAGKSYALGEDPGAGYENRPPGWWRSMIGRQVDARHVGGSWIYLGATVLPEDRWTDSVAILTDREWDTVYLRPSVVVEARESREGGA